MTHTTEITTNTTTTTERPTKRPTKTTLKTFIKNNTDKLYIRVSSRYDGMLEGMVSGEAEFSQVAPFTYQADNSRSYGVPHILMFKSDFVRIYSDVTFKGFEVSTTCGTFVLAVKK
jgi:hypothetical protein